MIGNLLMKTTDEFKKDNDGNGVPDIIDNMEKNGISTKVSKNVNININGKNYKSWSEIPGAKDLKKKMEKIKKMVGGKREESILKERFMKQNGVDMTRNIIIVILIGIITYLVIK